MFTTWHLFDICLALLSIIKAMRVSEANSQAIILRKQVKEINNYRTVAALKEARQATTAFNLRYCTSKRKPSSKSKHIKVIRSKETFFV